VKRPCGRLGVRRRGRWLWVLRRGGPLAWQDRLRGRLEIRRTSLRRRIAGLRRLRKVGQQALEADFLAQALQLLEISRRPRVRTGVRASLALSGPGRGGKAD
jgi:hypothetical protein